MTYAQENVIIFMPIAALQNDDVVGINLKDMTCKQFNTEELSEVINIDKKVLDLKNNWYLYNGEYYYYKSLFSAFKFLNELLGEYIALYMELPTVQYDIALNRGEIAGLLSKNFRKTDVNYVNAKKLRRYEYLMMKWTLKSNVITELRQVIDRMLIKDLYTCLSDRKSNVLCIRELFGIRLAPFYDYELSFCDINYERHLDEFNEYYNPLFVSNPFVKYSEMKPISYEDIRHMLKRDEYLEDQFDKIIDFNIEHALEVIRDKYNLTINDEILTYYKDFSDRRKKELIKNIKR